MDEIEPQILGADDAPQPQRSVWQAMLRGARGRCPACGGGRLFPRYLKVADHCPVCNEALHHHRADDAPPYFTMLIAGHLLVPALIASEIAFRPPLWVHALFWVPITIAVCLALLPAVKGAIVGLQWALWMHGFDPSAEDEETARADRVG